MRLLETRAGRLTAGVVGALLLAAIALTIGGLLPRQPLVPIAVALFVLVLGITAAERAAIPLLVVPFLVVVRRADLGFVDLTISDIALALATLTALVFTQRPLSPSMRNLLWLNGLYQGVTVFTVVLNPFAANAVEWFHAWMLVSGALLVGWTIGRAGFGGLGLGALLVAIIALAAVVLGNAAVQYARGDFGAVYVSWPYGMHKNFSGTVLGFGAAIAYARPELLRWRRLPADIAFWFMAVALLATQSRQAIVGLGVAVVFIAWRTRTFKRKRSALAVLAVAPALLFVATLVKDQVEEGSQFNSLFQRLSWFAETLEFWGRSPWVGHGLRFWTRGGEVAYQPPNVFLEVLASAGVLGLAAFVVMMAGVVVTLWRLDARYATVGIALLLSRLAQSQFDLFWISVQISIPFLVIGIGVGALALEERRRPWGRARRMIDAPAASAEIGGRVP